MKLFKTKKGKLSFLLLFAIVLQLVGPVVGDMAFAEGGNEFGSDMFTFISLKVDGNKIEEDTPINITGDTTVTVRYDYDIKYMNVSPGDTAKIKLPDVFKLEGTFSNFDLKVNDGSEKKIGTWTISEGYLVLTFDEGVNTIDKDNLVESYVEAGFKFDMIKFDSGVKQEIPFGDSVDKTFNIFVKPSAEGTAISKVGVPDGTGDGNIKDPKNITWTIDVINTEGTKLDNVRIEDTLPDGLSLYKNSFKKTPLVMGYTDGKGYVNGNQANIASTDVNTDTTGEFSLELGGLEPYQGYRIEYKTSIDGVGIASFENKVELFSGSTSKGTTKASVGGLTYTPPLAKIGVGVGNYKD